MKKPNYKYKDYEKALEKQKERYFKRVKQMLKKDKYKCYLLTFTFSDKTLEKTKATTRLRAIKSFLNKQASDYILNCDYGKKNKREHYHAFILSRYKVILYGEYKHGFLDFQKAHDTLLRLWNPNTKPTAENLTRHAFKDTTEESKIIYSRKGIKEDLFFKAKAEIKLSNYRNSKLGKDNKRLYRQMNGEKNTFLKQIDDLEREIVKA